MAMLAAKSPYNSSFNTSTLPIRQFSESSQRAQNASSALQDGLFTTPTESEFSAKLDGLDTVRAWNEDQVIEWLRSIRCGQYENLFRQNNFTGESLLECDQRILAELGIKKIGDRVRINVAIKQLRNKSSSRGRFNRDSMAILDNMMAMDASKMTAFRMQPPGSARLASFKSTSRPGSPMAEIHAQYLRADRHVPSPMDLSKYGQGSYFVPPGSASTVTGRAPETPSILVQSVKGGNHLRQSSNMNGLTAGGLPENSPVIKVIYGGGQFKIVNVKLCKSADQVTSTVLRKIIPANEKHFRNYCFYVLEGVVADVKHCRRLSDSELMQICEDPGRSERNRLILRKINDGAPESEDVKKAASLAYNESQNLHYNSFSNNNLRSRTKISQVLGATHEELEGPLSPALSTKDRFGQPIATADEDDQFDASDFEASRHNNAQARAPKLRTFYGARPPSEMIVQELTSYFPGHKSEDIEKTMRMSVRRSQRLSRAASRLSVMSNFSVASSLRDAPPVPAIPAVPAIADTWLNMANMPTARNPQLRPLSVSRFGLPGASYRDSVMSSALQPLQEESPTEPNRKSYVSFADSEPEPDSAITNDGQSFFGDSNSPVGTDINSRLSVIVADDDEEEDAALNSFLAGNQFDKNHWMKGDLIGEGSFGSVYLALHAVTGELMAVKQVELPTTGDDKKRTLMINALKQEINLLQGMHHSHIVQYLGTSSDETHLNIFLEYVPGGSIAGMLKQYNTFPEPLIRNFTRQILEGLAYLHNNNIIHRDIKGANILVDNRGAIKISDFGVSKKQGFNAPNAPGARTSLQGSVFWMAPEVVRQTGQSIKSDIWSVGCLIVEMFTGSRPFPLMTTLQTLFAVGSNGEKPSIPDSASDAARRFLELTFETDPNKRPGADELLKEPFMQALQQ